MPTFLGSSFAFIAALQAVIGNDDPTMNMTPMFGTEAESIPYALGGIIVAGGIYVVLALLIKLFGGPAFTISGIGLGILAGILLNLILPVPRTEGPGLVAPTVQEDDEREE